LAGHLACYDLESYDQHRLFEKMPWFSYRLWEKIRLFTATDLQSLSISLRRVFKSGLRKLDRRGDRTQKGIGLTPSPIFLIINVVPASSFPSTFSDRVFSLEDTYSQLPLIDYWRQ